MKALEPAEAAEARDLCEAWGAFGGTDRERLELSLGRLVSSERRSLGRFRYEDRLLDIAVALEVLFALEGGELTHKLSVRAAHLLGDSGEERLAVYESVQRLYKNGLGSSMEVGLALVGAGRNPTLKTSWRMLLEQGEPPS